MEGELKEDIHRKIENILAEQLQKINQEFLHWCEEFQHVEGQHFNTFCDVWILTTKF
jgi:hypothetical protein